MDAAALALALFELVDYCMQLGAHSIDPFVSLEEVIKDTSPKLSDPCLLSVLFACSIVEAARQVACRLDWNADGRQASTIDDSLGSFGRPIFFFGDALVVLSAYIFFLDQKGEELPDGLLRQECIIDLCCSFANHVY